MYSIFFSIFRCITNSPLTGEKLVHCRFRSRSDHTLTPTSRCEEFSSARRLLVLRCFGIHDPLQLLEVLSQFIQLIFTENHTHTVNGVMQNVGSAVHDAMKQAGNEFLFFSGQLIQRSFLQFPTTVFLFNPSLSFL